MNRSKVILKGLVGSHAYECANEDSDQDIMEVYIAPVSFYLGLDRVNKAKAVKTEKDEDITSYEFLHFVHLCRNGNPNVFPLLFLKRYMSKTNSGQELLNFRKAFLSDRMFTSLVGFSSSQKIRMVKNSSDIPNNLGDKRRNLIKKYGYDVKAATHAVRLLFLAKELFLNGVVDIVAPDVVRSIKEGLVPKEDVLKMFTELEEEVTEIFHNNRGVFFPKEPDEEAINKFCVEILRRNIC